MATMDVVLNLTCPGDGTVRIETSTFPPRLVAIVPLVMNGVGGHFSFAPPPHLFTAADIPEGATVTVVSVDVQVPREMLAPDPEVVAISSFEVIGDAHDYAYRRVLPEADTDHASAELVDLARRGDRSAFDALAGCLMPADEVADCWSGARRRLGLDP